MSAPADFEVLQIFLAEVRSRIDEGNQAVISSLLPEVALRRAELNEDLLCLAWAISGNRWYVPGRNQPRWSAYRNYVEGLRCRPLLGPWFNNEEWTPEGIAELKAAHAVTQALTNKDQTK